jgi:hypothetical protein
MAKPRMIVKTIIVVWRAVLLSAFQASTYYFQ